MLGLVLYYEYTKQKEYRKRLNAEKEMLDRGEMHDWTTILSNGVEVTVCRKTGWCPEKKGFFDTSLIPYAEKLHEAQSSMEEYKIRITEEVADRKGIDAGDLQDSILEIDRLIEKYQKESIESVLKDMSKELGK